MPELNRKSRIPAGAQLMPCMDDLRSHFGQNLSARSNQQNRLSRNIQMMSINTVIQVSDKLIFKFKSLKKKNNVNKKIIC